MARRNVCHSCRHKWKVGNKEWATECPKCGRGNVGPTDDSPSILPKLVMVVVILAGGAYYMGLLGGSVEDVKKGAQDLKRKAEEAARELQDEAPPSKSPVPVGSKGKKPPQKPAQKPAQKPKAPATPAPERPHVVVAGRSGAKVGSSYLVKGKIKNTGGVAAAGVKVLVIYKDKAGGVLETYEAECPSVLGPGESARFESGLGGDAAEQVEDFEAKVSFE